MGWDGSGGLALCLLPLGPAAWGRSEPQLFTPASSARDVRPEHPADRIPCAAPGLVLLSPAQPLLAPAPGAPAKQGASPRHVRKLRHGAAARPPGQAAGDGCHWRDFHQPPGDGSLQRVRSHPGTSCPTRPALGTPVPQFPLGAVGREQGEAAGSPPSISPRTGSSIRAGLGCWGLSSREMGQGSDERPQPRSRARTPARIRHKSQLLGTRPWGSSQALGNPSEGRAGARWERISIRGGERRALTARPCPLPAGAVPREARELSPGEVTCPLHRTQPLKSLKCL